MATPSPQEKEVSRRKRHRREILFSPDQMRALEHRRDQSGTPVSELVRRVAARLVEFWREGSLKERGFNRTAIKRFNEEHAPEFRTGIYFETPLWDAIWELKSELGVNIGDLIRFVVSKSLDEGDDPVSNATILLPPAGSGKSEATRRIVREELSSLLENKLAALGVVRGAALQNGEKPRPNPILGAERIAFETEQRESNLVALRQLDGVPCGPWQEALDHAEVRFLPRDLAEIIGAREGDLLVPSRGESMVEAGIPDNGLVVMRLLNGAEPAEGSIVLVSIVRGNGRFDSTIKHWFHSSTGRVYLTNGKMQGVSIPDDHEAIIAVAVLVGIMGRATMGTGTLKGRRGLK